MSRRRFARARILRDSNPPPQTDGLPSATGPAKPPTPSRDSLCLPRSAPIFGTPFQERIEGGDFNRAGPS